MWGSALVPAPELASHLSVWAGLGCLAELGWAGKAGWAWLGWQGWIGGLGWVTVTRKLKQEILWEESWIGAGYHQQIFRSLAHTEEEEEELKI